jgi:hypothetical protein
MTRVAETAYDYQKYVHPFQMLHQSAVFKNYIQLSILVQIPPLKKTLALQMWIFIHIPWTEIYQSFGGGISTQSRNMSGSRSGSTGVDPEEGALEWIRRR